MERVPCKSAAANCWSFPLGFGQKKLSKCVGEGRWTYFFYRPKLRVCLGPKIPPSLYCGYWLSQLIPLLGLHLFYLFGPHAHTLVHLSVLGLISFSVYFFSGCVRHINSKNTETKFNIIKFTFFYIANTFRGRNKKKWRPLFNFRVSRRNAPANGIEELTSWGLFSPANWFDRVSSIVVYKQIMPRVPVEKGLFYALQPVIVWVLWLRRSYLMFKILG